MAALGDKRQKKIEIPIRDITVTLLLVLTNSLVRPLVTAN